MNPVSICYLPPSPVGNVDSFKANLKKFGRRFPLICYGWQLEDPHAVQLKQNPEYLKSNAQNKLALANATFFTGVRIAADQGYTHIIVLEVDCRVGCHDWDGIMWDEMLKKNPEAIMAGSPVVFNPAAWSRAATDAYEKFLARTYPRVCPMPVAGSGRLAEKQHTAAFTNGALSIYRMDWLMKTFSAEMERTVDLAIRCRAWDYEIGLRLWNEFDLKAYDHIVSLNRSYSGYGELMTTESERKAWLSEGKVVAVHQVKSDWIGPDTAEKVKTEPEKEPVQPKIKRIKRQPAIKSRVQIFIVTYARDFPYLVYCLRSIEKFASGFSAISILVPDHDLKDLRKIVADYKGDIPIFTYDETEWPEKGFLWHECQIVRADEWCPDAEFIAHIDPDCIFTEQVTPDTFFKGGKPILRFEAFETIGVRHPSILRWKEACDRCLPFPVEVECMRGHPEIYHHGLYKECRRLMELKTGLPVDDYIKQQVNQFPQTFTEFPTLGAVAHHSFQSLYSLHDCAKQENPDMQDWPIIQFWSHSPPNKPQDIWIKGQKNNVTPEHVIGAILA